MHYCIKNGSERTIHIVPPGVTARAQGRTVNELQ